MCTPGVQNFLGCKMMKWGIVPQNGVRLAALIWSNEDQYNDNMKQNHSCHLFSECRNRTSLVRS